MYHLISSQTKAGLLLDVNIKMRGGPSSPALFESQGRNLHRWPLLRQAVPLINEYGALFSNRNISSPKACSIYDSSAETHRGRLPLGVKRQRKYVTRAWPTRAWTTPSVDE